MNEVQNEIDLNEQSIIDKVKILKMVANRLILSSLISSTQISSQAYCYKLQDLNQSQSQKIYIVING
jgi:hypothetical protein